MHNFFRSTSRSFMLGSLSILALTGCAPYNTTLERITQLETQQANTRQQLDEMKGVANLALNEAQAGEKRNTGKVIESLTLTNDRYLFPFNTLDLEKADTTLLDQLAERLKSRGRDYHLIIQGHTEDVGSAEHNYLLGEARANAVRRYLHTNQGIPLQHMSAISYGATKPLSSANANMTIQSNRRLVIEVTE